MSGGSHPMSGGSRAGIDPDALRYDAHWRPVLQDATDALLDRLEPHVRRRLGEAGEPPRLLDVGSGTGSLLLAAAARWPTLHYVAVDASGAMLGLARRRASETGLPTRAASFEVVASEAASMPLADGSVDVAASSFVLQLVPERAPVLAEVRRVLRAGGTFGFVTWLAQDVMMAADEAFDEAVYDLELDDPEPEGFREAKAGDFESVEAAERELAAAGFDEVDAREVELVHAWTPEAFLEFKRDYDERELFESLSAADGERLAERVRERWSDVPAEGFTLRAPLVSVVATRA